MHIMKVKEPQYRYRRDNNKKFKINESELFDDFSLNEADEENEDDSNGSSVEYDNNIDPEKLRTDSCKIALKLSKLFDAVSADDILKIAEMVSDFLMHHQAGDEYDPNFQFGDDKLETEPSDNEDDDFGDFDDFTIDDVESDDSDKKDVDTDEEDDEKEAENEGFGEIPNEFII